MLLIGFIIGAVVMDTAWAFKLGIPQVMWAMWKYKRALRKQPQEQELS